MGARAEWSTDHRAFTRLVPVTVQHVIVKDATEAVGGLIETHPTPPLSGFAWQVNVPWFFLLFARFQVHVF